MTLPSGGDGPAGELARSRRALLAVLLRLAAVVSVLLPWKLLRSTDAATAPLATPATSASFNLSQSRANITQLLDDLFFCAS